MHKMMTLNPPANSGELMNFLLDLVLLQFILLFKAVLLESPVNLKILLAMFNFALIV